MDYETYCRNALISYNDKDWFKTYCLIEKILLFDPEDLEWLFRAIEACNHEKQYWKSEEYCKRYLSISHSQEVRRLLAQAYIETNQLHQAIEICPKDMENEILLEIQQDFIPEFKDKIENITKWVVSNGGRIGNVKVRNFVEKSLGIVSANFTESGSELLYIPKNLIIYTDTCINAITEPFVDLFRSRHSLFALFISLERHNSNSFWTPYISLLPSDFSNYPILFTEKELKYLTGSSLLPLINIEKQYILDDYTVVSEANLVTYQEFIENRLLICSRLYSIKADKDTSGLVPFADLFNHKFDIPVSWNYDFDKEGFLIETQDSFDRNAELCIDYGPKSNIRLLLGYGFALENNQFDEFIFTLRLKKHDDLLERKQKIIGEKTQFKIKKNTEDACFFELFGFLRLKYCDSVDILTKNSEKYLNLKNIQFISIHNERQAINHLLKMCERSSAEFPTSLLEDSQRILEQDLTSNERNCLLVTKGEKEVLNWGIELCKITLNYLNSSSADILTPPTCYRSYLQFTIFPNLF